MKTPNVRELIRRGRPAGVPGSSTVKHHAQGAITRTQGVVHRSVGAPVFHCPVCSKDGVFVPSARPFRRALAKCSSCGALERHRTSAIALDQAPLGDGTVLELAPDEKITRLLRQRGYEVVGTDLFAAADIRSDVTQLPFAEASLFGVVAIHVLEHVSDDAAAIAEISRILRPDGFFVCAVPIVSDATIEYDEPCLAEHGHVRAPGPDYYERLKENFETVNVLSSATMPAQIQPYVYEDRTGFPTKRIPQRPAQQGLCHADYVAVCTQPRT